MAPAGVNDVSSPRFFTPLPFQGSQAAGPPASSNDHPSGDAHGVKRDAPQMMTPEERDERVRKIVSLVKVLLTGTYGWFIESRTPPSLVTHAPIAGRGR